MFTFILPRHLLTLTLRSPRSTLFPYTTLFRSPLLYPSITTVAGMRAKDFLQGWYATMASKRALEMYSWLDRNPGRAPAEIARVSRDKRSEERRVGKEGNTRTVLDSW